MINLGRQLLKNIFSSWIGYAVRLVITFFFIPFITGAFGDARYGVWVIIFQTIGYFALLDLGMGTALTRYVSKFLPEKDYPKINRYINSASLVYIFLGTIVFVLVWLFVTFFFNSFKISDPAMITEGKNALLIMGGFMAMNFYLFAYGNSMAAFQRHDINRILAIIEEILRVLVMVVLIKAGYGLVALAWTILTFSFLKHLAGLIIIKKLHKELHFSLNDSDSETIKVLFKYSRISFAITIGWLIIFNTDSFLLGLISGSAAAGIYNPAARLMLYLRNLVNAVGTPLIPAVSHLDGEKRYHDINRIYLKGVKYVTFISVVISVFVYFYAEHFTHLWLPEDFFGAADVMKILAVGSLFFLPQIIGNSVLFGIEKHKYLFYVVATESVLKIVLSLILIPLLGAIGMAMANTIPQLLIYPIFFPLLMSRLLGTGYRTVLKTELVSTILAFAVCLPMIFIGTYNLPPINWIMLVLNLLIVFIPSLFIFWFIIEKEDRLKIISFFKRA